MSRVDHARLRDLLRALVRARAFEVAMWQIDLPTVRDHRAPRSVSPAVEAAFALRRRSDGTGDVFTLRRGSAGAALLLGLEPDVLVRQALGRATAMAGGRDPGVLPTDLHRGLLSPVTLPGTLVEVMAGVAWAFRMRAEPRVALMVDDARGARSGFWHEGLNLAAVQRVPLVLVVDSHVRGGDPEGGPRIVDRVPAYGLEPRRAPGGDPAAILAAVEDAVVDARAGGGTQVVEVQPADGAIDPIEALAGRLEWAGVMPREELDAWMLETTEEMIAAVARVLDEPEGGAEHARASLAPDGAAPWTPPTRLADVV